MKLSVKMTIALLAIPFMSFAQDKTADEYKNEGNEFVRAKNFQSALESYEKAITLWGDSVDEATVYNAADCARRIKSFDKAMALYTQAKELNYKPDYATYYIADILGKTGKDAERIAVLEEGIEQFKIGKAAAFMKKGLVSEYVKDAAEIYNDAQKILGECATAKPEEYAAIEARSNARLAEAKPFVEKALAIDPNNEMAKKIASAIK